MKKNLIVGLGIFILSINSYSEIDLSKSFAGSTIWGYNGLEIRGNYTNVSLKGKEITKEFDLKNESIRNSIENLNRYLENDNKDVNNIFSIGYSSFNNNQYKNNEYSLLIGTSSNIQSRVGLKFNFIDGKIKQNSSKTKERDYSINLFYSAKNFNIISYIGKSELKENKEKRKSIYYGAYGKWKKELPYAYLGTFEYLEPSVYIDTQIQRYSFKDNGLKKRHSDTLNSTLGMEFKNNIEIDDVKITTTLNLGYNREFLTDRKYKSFNIKERAADNLVANLEVSVKYSEFIDIYGSYNTKKSLNNDHYKNKGTVGLRIRF